MALSQVERIMKSKAPLHMVAGQAYKGQPPAFAPIINPVTRAIVGWNKSEKGIPFVRVEKH